MTTDQRLDGVIESIREIVGPKGPVMHLAEDVSELRHYQNRQRARNCSLADRLCGGSCKDPEVIAFRIQSFAALALLRLQERTEGRKAPATAAD